MAIIDKPENLTANEQPFEDGEIRKPLSERDAICFIEMLENPPAPNEALKRAVARARKSVILRV